MKFALEGIRVIDASQVAAVPMCTRFLGDFGAEIIHVENSAGGDVYRGLGAGFVQDLNLQPEINFIWENYNRNKKSLSLNLAHASGQEIMHKLVSTADVFLTNMRPFEVEKFNIDYEMMSKINPRLVYGSLTGYGKKGPERNEPGYDFSSYWARSGIANRMPSSGSQPDVPPGAFGDAVAGIMMAFGVMAALRVSEKTGVGQEVDVSLFQTGIYQLSMEICGTIIGGQIHEEKMVSMKRESHNPLVKTYKTKDDRWLLFIFMTPDRYWPKFCRAIRREELENDPRFNSTEARKENSAALVSILEEVFLTKTLEEWKPILRGLPFDAIQTNLEAVNDPQAIANNFFLDYSHPVYGPMKVVANPVNLSKTPATLRLAAPQFSQHSEEILAELGYSDNDIKRLKDAGVIASTV